MWLALLLGFVLLLLAIFWRRGNLPPGPFSWPIIGALLQLDPRAPYLSLTKLAEKYGPVYGLYMGSVYTVVISDPILIKKVLSRDMASGRAPLYLTHGLMKGCGIICAQGDLWKDQRRFICNFLKNYGASKGSPNRIKLHDLILEHTNEMVQYLNSLDSTSITLDPLPTLRHTMGSIINEMVFGKSWNRDDQTWVYLQHLQEEGTKLIGVAGPINFLPFLRFLPSQAKSIRFLTEGIKETHRIYQKLINAQLETFTESNDDHHNNLIVAFYKEKAKRQGTSTEIFYNDQQCHYLLADIFGASLDTTLTTLRWYLLYLAVYKDVQDKVRDELKRIVGDSTPNFDDLASMPFMEASLAETQRIRSVVPVGIPHGALDDLEITGYRIPKGTMIIPLQWAVHMNPTFWEEPDKFRPERFISEEGKFLKPDHFMPFQTGKRMCVGDELARMFLFYFASTILINFELTCDNYDLDGECGITLTPKPQQITFTKIIQ